MAVTARRAACDQPWRSAYVKVAGVTDAAVCAAECRAACVAWVLTAGTDASVKSSPVCYIEVDGWFCVCVCVCVFFWFFFLHLSRTRAHINAYLQNKTLSTHRFRAGLTDETNPQLYCDSRQQPDAQPMWQVVAWGLSPHCHWPGGVPDHNTTDLVRVLPASITVSVSAEPFKSKFSSMFPCDCLVGPALAQTLCPIDYPPSFVQFFLHTPACPFSAMQAPRLLEKMADDALSRISFVFFDAASDPS
jgi:hypothetical protein